MCQWRVSAHACKGMHLICEICTKMAFMWDDIVCTFLGAAAICKLTKQLQSKWAHSQTSYPTHTLIIDPMTSGVDNEARHEDNDVICYLPIFHYHIYNIVSIQRLSYPQLSMDCVGQPGEATQL